MKVSVKLQDHHHQNHHKIDPSPPLLLRAKVPITIFNQPFLSHFSTTTTHPSDLSLSLSTNFPSCPSLKLSYATTSSAATPPLTLSLKSGTGIFGSPKYSPLVISAHFSFNPSNPSYPNPTFSLLFKPRLGSFSLRKTTFSHPKPDVSSECENGDSGSDSNSFAFVASESPVAVLEKMEHDSIITGMQLTANTHVPMAKRAALNLRWRMDFLEDKMPVLRINKIGIERVEEMVKEDDEKKMKSKSSTSEVEMLKDMCLWMQRELDGLTRVNKEMQCELAEIKGRCNSGDNGGNVRKKAMPAVGRPSTGFDQWKKNKKIGGSDDNGNLSKRSEDNKNGSLAMDVENELERAIKAASSSP